MNPDNPFPTTSQGVRDLDRGLPGAPFDEPLDTSRDQDIAERRLRHGVPARPLLGVLPLARWIPQDVHSLMDYAAAAVTGAGALVDERDDAARTASIALAASVAGVSLLTDYRLSAIKLVPIEAHEAVDHLWGAAAIAAPFVFGYWRTSPVVGLMHVITGASTILASLVTDYRAYRRGRGVVRRRRGDA